MDEELGNIDASSQEIVDLNREIRIVKEDILEIRKANEIKINTLAKVHLGEIEDIKKENNLLKLHNKEILSMREDMFHEHGTKFEELKKVNGKLKQNYEMLQESMNVTIANKDEEVAQAHSKIGQIENSNKGLQNDICAFKDHIEQINMENLSHEKEAFEEVNKFQLRNNREKERALKLKKKENIALMNHKANCSRCCD